MTTTHLETPPEGTFYHFTSPVERYAEMPSFVVGEAIFILLALITFIHALGQRDALQKARHLCAWFAALFAGTANDLYFMAVPGVDNFWHGQASIMVTPRLPLYICCVYISFMYVPTVAAWRIPVSTSLGRASLSGLLAGIFYYPFDVAGAKFLWWTWHESDIVTSTRFLGAPVSSTLWTLTFVFAYSWLLGIGLGVDSKKPVVAKSITSGRLAFALILTALSTFVMVLVMAPVQIPDDGKPGKIALATTVSLFALLAIHGLSTRSLPASPRSRIDKSLAISVLAYFVSLVAILLSYDPTTHRSASFHQLHGPCGVPDVDVAGRYRSKTVCRTNFTDDYEFCLADPKPDEMASWYTVCGKPFDDRTPYLIGVGGVGLLAGTLIAGWGLWPRSGAKTDEKLE